MFERFRGQLDSGRAGFGLSAISFWTEYESAQAESDSVFDNSVERASRERTDSGISPKRSHKMDHGIFAQKIHVVASTSFRAMELAAYLLPVGRRTGFKREFDPGSESTLAACLTHASRTRKWSNP